MVDRPNEVDPRPSLQQILLPVVGPLDGEQHGPALTVSNTSPPWFPPTQQRSQDVSASGGPLQGPHAPPAAAAGASGAAAAAGPSRPAQQPLQRPQLDPAAQLALQGSVLLQQLQQQSPATPQPLGVSVSAAEPAAAASPADAAAAGSPRDSADAAAAGPSSSSTAPRRLPDSPEDPDVVKVSSRSRVSSVAGKIAHDVRDGRLPRIMVAGNQSISTAAKAIVQARRYLRAEGQDIAFSPIFRSTDHSRALLELALVLMPRERGTAADNLAALDNAGGHETRIANSSRHARAGSAAAHQLRSRGICVLCSVGQDALANAVMACAHAGCFLQDSGQQMVVQPVHVVLYRGDQDLHAIKLVVTFV